MFLQTQKKIAEVNTHFEKNTAGIALKIIKRGVGMYFWLLCYGYALNYHFVYLAIPGTHLLFMRKQNKFVLLICNWKKMKFTSVQINKNRSRIVYLIYTNCGCFIHFIFILSLYH